MPILFALIQDKRVKSTVKGTLKVQEVHTQAEG